MKKLLTIVVPIYNVEPYIRKCLDSLILDSSLMELMDVLVINDGTPDRSADISREYTLRFPGVFRQIDKENGGHGSVWNLGIKEAYGKYLKFLDSDDWLENLDIMIRKLENTDADLIITSNISHCPGNVCCKWEIKDMEFDYVYDADQFDWLGNRSFGYFTFHQCAIYKTDMFRQDLPLFPEKQLYDDTILCAAPIIGAKSLVAWDLEVYQYLMDREGQSISLEVQRRNVDAKIRAQRSTIEFVEKHPVPEHSTKHAFFAKRLPKLYGYGYTALLDILPYKDAHKFCSEWEDWVRKKAPWMRHRWRTLYNKMPFFIYWVFYKSCVRGLALYKKMHNHARILL